MASELGFKETGVGALVTCILLIGATFGSAFAGGVADRYGPRTALALCAIPMAIGSALCALPRDAGQLWVLLVGRTVAGVGVGAVSVYAPRYLAETSADAIRGALGTMNQVTMNVGIMIAYVVGLPYSSGLETHWVPLFGEVYWWRVMLGAAVVPALIQLFGMLVCPESPVWLEWKGRREEAKEALVALHGPVLADEEIEIMAGVDFVNPANEPLLGQIEQLHSMQSGLASALSEYQFAEQQTGYGAIFAPEYSLVLLLAGTLQAMQQTSGINTLVFYSSKVFAGMANPILGSIAVGAMNSTMTVFSGLLVDRAGRKPLMLVSCSGMAVCLSFMSLLPALGLGGREASNAMLGIILVYVSFFALGAGPIPRLYGAEIIPPEIKGHMQALTTAINWIATLAVGFTFPSMIQYFGVAGAYLFYAVLNALGVAFVSKYMVETKQRSLVEIRALLVKEQPQDTRGW